MSDDENRSRTFQTTSKSKSRSRRMELPRATLEVAFRRMGKTTPEDQGHDLRHFMECMQAIACVNPGVFKGSKARALSLFEGLIENIGILMTRLCWTFFLVDDHLEGRARSVFLSLEKLRF